MRRSISDAPPAAEGEARTSSAGGTARYGPDTRGPGGPLFCHLFMGNRNEPPAE